MDKENKKYFFSSIDEKKNVKEIFVIQRNNIMQIDMSIYGSKSFTNRAIVLAGMSARVTKIEGFLFSEDSYWGLQALSSLGFRIKVNYSEKSVIIYPPIENFQNYFEIYYGKAGTLARFFPAVILNWQKTFPKFSKIKVLTNADDQLIKRPIYEIVHALKEMNANISCDKLPMQISSSNIFGNCKISGKTSGQFLSGLIFTAFGAKSLININRIDNLVQPDYVRMTLKSIETFGGQIKCDQELTHFQIFPSFNIGTDCYQVEADASTCCYFISLAYLHNFSLRIRNLGQLTLQPDFHFISFLKELGALIEFTDSEIFVFRKEVYEKPKGNFTFNFSKLSDQALTMGIIALFAAEPIEIRNIIHIRHHESDRISCFINNLRALNIQCDEFVDGFRVYPFKKGLNNLVGQWKTFVDHRFVMSGFILASFAQNISIENPSCVEKTAPMFFQQLKDLGFQFKITEA
ncbi:3-phosphoshikimate 1-carboxyvinyltransferase [Fluviispira multicolorata]|uniref:3-phosphoshikimate 1-carboxyvinyltransferase n=1 Tax=Fluviispira multicolorata TaxID=2654512 RepID=A0A833JFV2_9BACT|nr:3-phosphoshikimate 1-carboxyvinyltransferase [Fluviispira multicolorata]KAB8033545.1 3-phosphoshikimate 1-carboxyvinyltransferase [Fluviispira multicolorata]